MHAVEPDDLVDKFKSGRVIRTIRWYLLEAEHIPIEIAPCSDTREGPSWLCFCLAGPRITFHRSAARRASSRLTAFLIKRQTHTTAFENAVVATEIADKLKVGRKAGVLEHAPGIAAHGEDPAGFYLVMFVEHKVVWIVGHGAAIDDGLTVVFTIAFQVLQFE